MKITAPSVKRPPPPVAPAGRWRGRITEVQAREVEAPTDEPPTDEPPSLTLAWPVILTWHFAANNREWDLPQVLPDAGSLGNLLVDLGLADQEVELANIVDREAMIIVRTTGSKTGARIIDTDPLPEEPAE